MIEKITTAEIYANSVERLSDYPNSASRYGTGGLSAAQLKAKYDLLAKLAITKLNETIDSIIAAEADTDAIIKSIMTQVPTGEVDTEGNPTYKSLDTVIADVLDGDFAGYLALTGLTEDDLQTELETIEDDIDDLETSVGASDDTASATGSVYARIAKNAADISTNASGITTLDGNKVNKSDIVNDLTTGGATKVLSAEQGKTLKGLVDAKIPTSAIVNDLATGGASNVLSAEQGKTLKGLDDLKVPISAIVNDLTTGGTAVPLSAEQGKALKTALGASGDAANATGTVYARVAYNKGKAEAAFVNIAYNATTGVITVTANDGSTKTIDLPMELLISSGEYDEESKDLVVTLANGQTIAIPLDEITSALVTQINTKADKVTGATSGNLAGLDANGNLTDSGKSVAALEASEDNAEAWAVGTISGVAVESSADQYENNAKYYSELAATAKEGAEAAKAATEAIALDLSSSLIKKYTVLFSTSANPGTRKDNAVGLVAGVGTDTQTATNDFDNIYPWSARRRCCGTWNASGNFVVNAYKGEPGYAVDGSNGEVWIEHSLFYFKHTYNGAAEEISISPYPIPGYSPAPIFVKPDGSLRQKAYTAAYPLATVGGLATSRSGVFSDVCSLNSAMTAARTLGANYTVTTTSEWYTDWLYMVVEFATRNLQSIMNGASGMPYDATHTAVVAETGVNRIIIANAKAAAYVVGQTIIIGTTQGGTNVANNRVVTAISAYDADNKAIEFDGAAVNIAIGNIACTAAYKNGSCDGVLSSSGSPVSNTDGKHNCIYRGKETPYANAFEFISDVLFKREGAGTTESPYTYDAYYLPDPTKYNAGSITADYVKLNYQIPQADGYPVKLGLDGRYPHVRLPSQLGGSSSINYADYYYYPRDAIAAARVGGSWIFGSYAGPCCWACNNAPSYSNVYARARLSFHRS